MTLTGRAGAKAASLDECVDQGRRLEDRNRLDTVLVPAVNDADCLWLVAVGARNRSVWALGIVCSQG